MAHGSREPGGLPEPFIGGKCARLADGLKSLDQLDHLFAVCRQRTGSRHLIGTEIAGAGRQLARRADAVADRFLVCARFVRVLRCDRFQFRKMQENRTRRLAGAGDLRPERFRSFGPPMAMRADLTPHLPPHELRTRYVLHKSPALSRRPPGQPSIDAASSPPITRLLYLFIVRFQLNLNCDGRDFYSPPLALVRS